MRWTTFLTIAVPLLACAGEAAAQFGTPGSTSFRERIVGDLLEGGGGENPTITPETGDQIGAFFNGEVVGVFAYTDASRDFSVTIFGDDPDTEQVEGPSRGDAVEFRYFDSSTNQTLTLTVLNPQGEVFNFNFQGVEVFDVPGLPLDLTPTRTFNLRAGAPTGGGSSGGGGSGGGGAAPGGGTDINGDGGTDVRDAAIILRALSGAVRPGSRAFRDLGVMVTDPVRSDPAPEGMIQLSADALLGRCDVNNDGLVTSADAVVSLRAGRGPSG